MATTPEGEEYLNWCADRAILELNNGSALNALSLVLSDFTKSGTTKDLDPLIVVGVVGLASHEGPEALRQAIMGFSV